MDTIEFHGLVFSFLSCNHAVEMSRARFASPEEPPNRRAREFTIRCVLFHREFSCGAPPFWLSIELHCALENRLHGYTLLSINNLSGYKSVTHQLHRLQRCPSTT